MPGTAKLATLEQRIAAGVTAAELVARSRHRYGISSPLTPRELERWLLQSGLATNGDGLLRPTAAALALADALGEVG